MGRRSASLAVLFATCLLSKPLVAFCYFEHLLAVGLGGEAFRDRSRLIGPEAPVFRGMAFWHAARHAVITTGLAIGCTGRAIPFATMNICAGVRVVVPALYRLCLDPR